MTETKLDLDRLEATALLAKQDMHASQSRALYTHRVTFDPPTALAMIARIRELEAKLAASEKRAEAWKKAHDLKTKIGNLEICEFEDNPDCGCHDALDELCVKYGEVAANLFESESGTQ